MLNIIFHTAVFILDGEKKISLSEYNKLLDKFNILNTRTQQLELNEYKRNNPGYVSLLNNVSTAYKLIDNMLKFKPDAVWDELFENDKPVEKVCLKTVYTLRVRTNECLQRGCYGCDVWKVDTFNFTSYEHLKWKYDSFFIPGHRGDVDESRFSMTSECKEMIPFEQSSIKGYVEYKHAYNTNDKQWMKQIIQQIKDENKDYHFEDIVNEFRKRYHRIYEDDNRLYKLIGI